MILVRKDESSNRRDEAENGDNNDSGIRGCRLSGDESNSANRVRGRFRGVVCPHQRWILRRIGVSGGWRPSPEKRDVPVLLDSEIVRLDSTVADIRE